MYIVRKDLKEICRTKRSDFLETRGYQCDNFVCCINRLIMKLREEPDFPHEIGLFLGYPLEDVKSFIENKADCSKCSGCWKVYGNEQEALKLLKNIRNVQVHITHNGKKE